jgi:hypothetical protein
MSAENNSSVGDKNSFVKAVRSFYLFKIAIQAMPFRGMIYIEIITEKTGLWRVDRQRLRNGPLISR